MKKVVGLFISFLFLIILTGCKGDTESVEKALTKLEGYKNYEITMRMNLAMKQDDQSANISMKMDIKQFNESKIMMTTSMNMGLFSISDYKTYFEKADNKYYLYTEDYTTGNFAKTEIENIEESEMLTNSELDSMLSDLGEIKKIGTAEIDGKKYTKYETILDFDSLKNNPSFSSSLEATGGEIDEELFNKIKVYLYIDTDKDEFKRLEMDFIDYMKAYMEKHADETDNTEVSKFVIYLDLNSVNSVKDFNYPEVTEQTEADYNFDFGNYAE